MTILAPLIQKLIKNIDGVRKQDWTELKTERYMINEVKNLEKFKCGLYRNQRNTSIPRSICGVKIGFF